MATSKMEPTLSMPTVRAIQSRLFVTFSVVLVASGSTRISALGAPNSRIEAPGEQQLPCEARAVKFDGALQGGTPGRHAEYDGEIRGEQIVRQENEIGYLAQVGIRIGHTVPPSHRQSSIDNWQ
jgi:hypothetical protein